jgi:hypothetical protein
MFSDDKTEAGKEQRVGKKPGSAEFGVPVQSRLGKASFVLGLTSIVMILVFGCRSAYLGISADIAQGKASFETLCPGPYRVFYGDDSRDVVVRQGERATAAFP